MKWRLIIGVSPQIMEKVTNYIITYRHTDQQGILFTKHCKNKKHVFSCNNCNKGKGMFRTSYCCWTCCWIGPMIILKIQIIVLFRKFIQLSFPVFQISLTTKRFDISIKSSHPPSHTQSLLIWTWEQGGNKLQLN